ncbi:hypothetical protein [Cohaesibacter gelatinilyticus]|uniref:Uncharacterized protein n=1 Tax=Cohaesibacter gelatinilyticus TaxID=372072 RepID=A0A285NGF9_9HYPH|nr:hypothetical protein [Cohaesibacter gelatinilyticus]SNZ07983.1 hypothetical protein SAMN06265368_1371 [Cohaesibacter gelatinilyticus]
MRRQSIRLVPLFSCLAASLVSNPTAIAASSVTTERIIGLPNYSTSSQETPATLNGDINNSAGSGASLNGDEIINQEPEGAEGQLAVPPLEADLPITIAPDAPLPRIFYDISSAPSGVQRMHATLLEATQSGDMEKMRIAIEINELPPIIGFDEGETDPIAQLRSLSGDPEGSEILAIMNEILEAGYIIQDKGTPQELYIWPYFADYPLSRLTRPQRVELFRLITAGDYSEMQALGHYMFYRIAIGPDGTWHYFTASD